LTRPSRCASRAATAPTADRNPTYEREVTPAATFELNETPEGVIADSARQLQAVERERDDARRIAREASQAAANARAEADRARANQAQDQQAVVAQALEAANAEMSAAEAALQSAIEAGDARAQVAASKAIGTATFRMSQASAELARIKDVATRQPVAARPPTNQPSARAQQWLNDHPRYNTDKAYKAYAHLADSEARQMGYSGDSQEYIDYIENAMTQQFGENHGHAPTDQGRTPPVNNQRTPSARDGVPPSRSNGGANNGGWQPVTTPLHAGASWGNQPLLVQKGPNNTMKIRFSSKEQQTDFQEGADTCRMPLADYVLDQINGDASDLVRGDGAKFE
jgi:hypothetical protein